MVDLLSTSITSGAQTLTSAAASPATGTISQTSAQVSSQSHVSNGSDSSRVSSLARQLSEAAPRAEDRESSLTRKELASYALATSNKLFGSAYMDNKAEYDAELPTSGDTARLEQAKSATAFANGLANNPFAGMARDQLDLIAYDDSGSFTVNEKRAALYEAQKQESAWRADAVAKAAGEYDSTGKLTNFFQTVLDHYKILPAVEQARYPDDYETKLQSWIDSDFNYFTNKAEGESNPEILANQVLRGDSTLFVSNSE